MEQVDNRWKIKREISIADIISFLCAALAVVYAYTTLDKRMAIIEAAMVEAKVESKRQEASMLRVQTSIEQKIDKLDEKIDRLVQGRR